MTSASTEIPGGAELMKQIEQNDLDNVSVLGCLPEHNVVDKPSMITWGTRSLTWQSHCYTNLHHNRCLQ